MTESRLPTGAAPMTDARSGPLDDVTIIDCTMAYAGPFGTALLADLGADVIKVEPPTGDTFRMLPPFPPDYGHAAPQRDRDDVQHNDDLVDGRVFGDR